MNVSSYFTALNKLMLLQKPSRLYCIFYKYHDEILKEAFFSHGKKMSSQSSQHDFILKSI